MSIIIGLTAIFQTVSAQENAPLQSEGAVIANGDVTEIVRLRAIVRTEENEIGAWKLYSHFVPTRIAATALSSAVDTSAVAFIAYGPPSAKDLGERERAGVLNSYQRAFGRLPATAAQWEDVVAIANGRWPIEKSSVAEQQADAAFLKIYGREPDSANTADTAARAIAAYGLRPRIRSIANEQAAAASFTRYYGWPPATSEEWDIVRAIAYSGARR